MRWPWQPKPGFVRINHKELIELLRGALRAAELEEEIRQTDQKTRSLEAASRAWELLEERLSAGEDTTGVREGLLDEELPMTGDGVLHEEAFLALVDARRWSAFELQRDISILDSAKEA